MIVAFPALGFDPAPGDPEALRASAAAVDVVGRSLSTAAGSVAGLDAGWTGDAAAAFRARLGQLPRDLGLAATAHSATARTLLDYADGLAGRRRRAAGVGGGGGGGGPPRGRPRAGGGGARGGRRAGCSRRRRGCSPSPGWPPGPRPTGPAPPPTRRTRSPARWPGSPPRSGAGSPTTPTCWPGPPASFAGCPAGSPCS